MFSNGRGVKICASAILIRLSRLQMLVGSLKINFLGFWVARSATQNPVGDLLRIDRNYSCRQFAMDARNSFQNGMTSSLLPDCQIILSQAAKAPPHLRPAAKAVVAALLQAEKTAKQQRLSYPFSSLQGTWQLCFTTGTRKVKRGGIILGNGFYMPRISPAQIGFATGMAASELGEITNQIQVAGLKLRLTGLCRYMSKKNLLAFDFNQMQITAFDRPLHNGKMGGRKDRNFSEQPIAKLPFFTFFLVTENHIAARGRGGGLALWSREF